MVIAYFFIMCLLAAFNILLLHRLNPKQNGPYPVLFYAIFIACVGHLLVALSTNVDQVIIANKLNYIGAIFLPLLTFDASLSVCNIRLNSFVHAILVILVFFVYCLSATVGYSDIYYKTIEFVQTYGVGNYVATYGFGHDIFNIMMSGFVVANVALIVYAFIRKRNVSFKSLIALSLIELSSILSLFVSRILENDMVVMPAVYIFDQIALLYVCYRVKRYDVEQTVSESLEADNADGFILISFRSKFLGCNPVAYKFFPELKNCRIDHSVPPISEMTSFMISWMDEIRSGEFEEEKNFEQGSKHYKIKLRKHPNVHLFKIEDDTELQRYIKMLGTNNVKLELMLRENASQIRSIQEQMIVGMANMVESRDSNTGSHVKRTSKVVSILVDYLRKDNRFNYSDFFYDSVVSAAPMHDIGKIAIDDCILRKPGRFTPKEYEEMKSHPEKGAMIVENLLTSIENPEFVQIVKNVAWFHHERFDGFGYPKGLKGTDIPFEARIMAVADVYDALVSKRCYKERISFKEAYSIITEGMGTQFDPSLKDCFVACRSRLEEYYMNLSETEA